MFFSSSVFIEPIPHHCHPRLHFHVSIHLTIPHHPNCIPCWPATHCTDSRLWECTIYTHESTQATISVSKCMSISYFISREHIWICLSHNIFNICIIFLTRMRGNVTLFFCLLKFAASEETKESWLEFSKSDLRQTGTKPPFNPQPDYRRISPTFHLFVLLLKSRMSAALFSSSDAIICFIRTHEFIIYTCREVMLGRSRFFCFPLGCRVSSKPHASSPNAQSNLLISALLGLLLGSAATLLLIVQVVENFRSREVSLEFLLT